MTTLKRSSFNKMLNHFYGTDTKSLGEEFPHLYLPQQEELYASSVYSSPFYHLSAQLYDIHRLAADQLHDLRQQQDEIERKSDILHKIIKAVCETDTLQARPKDYMKDIVDPEFEGFLEVMLSELKNEITDDDCGYGRMPHYIYSESLFKFATSVQDSMKTRELEIKAWTMLRIYQTTSDALAKIAGIVTGSKPEEIVVADKPSSKPTPETNLCLLIETIPAPELKTFLRVISMLRKLRNTGIHYFENQEGSEIRAENFDETAILFQLGTVSRLLAEVEKSCETLPRDSEARRRLGFQTNDRSFTLEDF